MKSLGVAIRFAAGSLTSEARSPSFELGSRCERQIELPQSESESASPSSGFAASPVFFRSVKTASAWSERIVAVPPTLKMFSSAPCATSKLIFFSVNASAAGIVTGVAPSKPAPSVATSCTLRSPSMVRSADTEPAETLRPAATVNGVVWPLSVIAKPRVPSRLVPSYARPRLTSPSCAPRLSRPNGVSSVPMLPSEASISPVEAIETPPVNSLVVPSTATVTSSWASSFACFAESIENSNVVVRSVSHSGAVEDLPSVTFRSSPVSSASEASPKSISGDVLSCPSSSIEPPQPA